MLKGNDLPGCPNNDRILVRPDPPEDKQGALWVPDVAKIRAHHGTILHAGLKARDFMWDHDHRIGDRIFWGQFAGALEAWDHITKPGKDPKCNHDKLGPDEQWARQPSGVDRVSKWSCASCGAERTEEPIIVANVEDILMNETHEERARAGKVSVVRGETAEGETMHFIQRHDIETKGAKNVA